MSSTSLIIIGMVGGLVLLLAFFLFAKALRARGALQEFLDHHGFVPCYQNADDLAQQVNDLCQRTNAEYSVGNAYKASWNGNPVYYFSVTQILKGHHRLGPSDAFLIPFRSAADLPFVLYLKPTTIALPFFVENFITSILTASDALRPDLLTDLELSDEDKSAGVLAAFSTEPGALGDVLDAETLQVITQSGDYGCFGFHYGEGVVLLTMLRELKLPDVDLEKQWTYFKKLTEH